jgi:hypothetical protein
LWRSLLPTVTHQHVHGRLYSTTLISGTRGAKNGVKGCPKRAPLAPRRPRDREPLFLGLCSHPPSLSPLLQVQNIASPKRLSTTYAPDLSKTAARATYCIDRFNYKYGRSSFLLASSLLQHANRPHNFLTQPSLNYLSPPQDHLPHARFCSHFQLVSRLYIAVPTHTSGLSSL